MKTELDDHVWALHAMEAAIQRDRGAQLLDDVAAFLARFVAFPSTEARDAVALWTVHAHAILSFESTPRLAVLSPEKGSGKTRCLEVLELLTPEPMHAVNATPAALFRAVEAKQPTILFDEIDTYFGPKAKDHEELRGLLNAGHRKGAVAYRCVGEGTKMEVKEFPAYCAVALAGIGGLPDTILDRSVVVRMRRRAPDERVEPFRIRKVTPPGTKLKARIAAWVAAHHEDLADIEPDMPLEDRPADVWEPLVAIADTAGGHWPARAREVALALNAVRSDADASYGVRLLTDVAAVFAAEDVDAIFTATIVEKLNEIEDAPYSAWGRGAGIKPRDIARILGQYEITPKDIRMGATVRKGYRRSDLDDALARYAPAPRVADRNTATATASATPELALTSGNAPSRGVAVESHVSGV